MASTASTGEEKSQSYAVFDMGSLSIHLPQKRGLSSFFSGKSKSFKCLSEAKCISDLKKAGIPEAKRRKYVSSMSEQSSLRA